MRCSCGPAPGSGGDQSPRHASPLVGAGRCRGAGGEGSRLPAAGHAGRVSRPVPGRGSAARPGPRSPSRKPRLASYGRARQPPLPPSPACLGLVPFPPPLVCHSPNAFLVRSREHRRRSGKLRLLLRTAYPDPNTFPRPGLEVRAVFQKGERGSRLCSHGQGLIKEQPSPSGFWKSAGNTSL